MRRIIISTLHNAIVAPAVSPQRLVEDFRHLTLLILAVGATGTIKVKASDAANIVDFSAPSTINNPWYYVDLKGLGDGAVTVVGTTGIALAASTTQKGYAVNTDNMRWISVDVEALSAGSVSVLLSGATND